MTERTTVLSKFPFDYHAVCELQGREILPREIIPKEVWTEYHAIDHAVGTFIQDPWFKIIFIKQGVTLDQVTSVKTLEELFEGVRGVCQDAPDWQEHIKNWGERMLAMAEGISKVDLFNLHHRRVEDSVYQHQEIFGLTREERSLAKETSKG